MTLRNVVLAALLVVLVVAGSAVPAGAKAPTTLTINANPNPILAGEEVLIYGYLKGPDNADNKVVLHGQSVAGGTFAVKGTMVTNAGLLHFRSWRRRCDDVRELVRHLIATGGCP
jgi:hypothetical protein